MKHLVLSANSPEGLNAKVSEYLNKGWIAVGSHHAVEHHRQNRYSGSQHMDTIIQTEYSQSVRLLDPRDDSFKVVIDDESISIHHDPGSGHPTHIAYWHKDEWMEDPSIVVSIANAIHLFHTDREKLFTLLGFKDLTIIKS